MKTLTTYVRTRQEKELFVKIVLLSTLAIGVYTVRTPKLVRVEPPKEDNIFGQYNDQFGDFDRAPVPNKPVVIAKMMKTLQPSMSKVQKNKLSLKMHQVLAKYDIAPQIVVSIIDTESNFNQDAVSSTGDLSMAQVNVEVWNREFARLNRPLIDSEKLKKDEVYALETMAEILTLLKNRYEKTDRRWYARYHSKSKKFKGLYLEKLERRMKKLEDSNVISFKKTSKPRLLALQ